MGLEAAALQFTHFVESSKCLEIDYSPVSLWCGFGGPLTAHLLQSAGPLTNLKKDLQTSFEEPYKDLKKDLQTSF